MSQFPLQTLPFDQYGRYQLIREAVDAARSALGSPLRVLDVGGFFVTRRNQAMLPARAFLPNDEVTVLDRPAADLEGYVQGDGRGLHFGDDSFDVVISCDTLEHVPAPDRPAFWRELLRVARYGVLLAAPFASPETVAAEALLLDYIKAALGVDQPQLREHAEFGLPERALTVATLGELGLRYRVYPTGYVHAWLTMMLAKHTPVFADYDLHERLDSYYTSFFGPDERREPAYRLCWVVEKNGQGGWLDAVDHALAPTIRNGPPAAGPGWPDLATWLLQVDSVQRHQTQAQAIATQAQTIYGLQAALAQREAHIRDLEQRTQWLDEQARESRRALAAVENGLVLRLLRRLRRK
ncbi:MAG: class I SAM-dependent methyltransferase [Chloroflexaceae bacterium]|jgi:SAM-dependent methyltransferase|nr:class I SAM-dependent methyltransferase [Chloroflexaceae bacterium]